MLRLSSFFSVLSGGVIAAARRVLKVRLELEVIRFFVYFGLFVLVSAWAKFISIPGVPFFYIELILLAPFLRYGWPNVLIGLSILTSIARLVQGFYGFDQLFIPAYLLFVNISGFPMWVTLASLIAIVVGLFALIIAIKDIPRFFLEINVLVCLLVVLACIGVKMQEDNSKSNLIGTSFGYLFGQLRFAEMFYGRYEVPMLSKEPYPGYRGADYAVEHGTNFVLIVVESMGVPSIQLERDKLFSGFGLPEVVKKYAVVEGVVPARGSTIHGEIRELCGGRLSRGLFGESGNECIPRMMAQAGYETTAIHANYAKMYGRDEWYPKVGFKNYINTSTGELPYDHSDDRWGSALDTSLIEWLLARDERQGKNFEYVLTVSTHLPAVLLPGAKVWGSCSRSMTEHSCTHLANLKLVLDRISAYALQRQNTTFVIVGDHPPPFVSPASRAGFRDFEVPYVILQPKMIQY
jgi:hypothetical protein